MAVFELENLKPLPEREIDPLEKLVYCIAIKSWIISFWQTD
jgi:hypothetical protein